MALIDGHCHLVLARDVDRAGFERSCNEADTPPPPGVSCVDSQLGAAVRRWCPPALGLPAHTSMDDYLERRAELGWAAATAALLRRAELGALLVDTGLDGAGLDATGLDGAGLAGTGLDGVGPGGAGLVTPAELAELAGASVAEVVRLERVAEQLAGRTSAAGFVDAYAEALAERTERTGRAVAVKSIIAYRYGLAVPPQRPSRFEVRRAADAWLRSGGRRLTDPVLLRHVLWAGVDTGLPLQLHTGFGDRDLALGQANPTLAQPLLAAIEPAGNPVVLLHCYPYHRGAGWLAQVYPHVYVDVGLTMTQLGAGAGTVLAEFVELAPFGKLLFSTDAYLLAELYLVGAAQFRHSLRRLLDSWLADDAITTGAAERITQLVGAGNAERIYPRLGA